MSGVTPSLNTEESEHPEKAFGIDFLDRQASDFGKLSITILEFIKAQENTFHTL